jgi:hypothetical protein
MEETYYKDARLKDVIEFLSYSKPFDFQKPPNYNVAYLSFGEDVISEISIISFMRFLLLLNFLSKIQTETLFYVSEDMFKFIVSFCGKLFP